MNRRQFLAASALAFQYKYPLWKFNLTSDAPAVAVRQAYVQNVRNNRAVIMWATQSPGSGYVQYTSDGTNFKYATARTRTFPTSETFAAAAFTQYTALLPRLSPNTTYSYSPVVNGDAIAGSGTFATAPTGSTAFRFLVMGDSGMGSSALDSGVGQGRIANLLSKETAAFLLHVGDIAYGNGNYDQFQQRYFDYYPDIMSRMPFFTTPGNHEYDNPDAGAYYAVHNFPTETVKSSESGRYYSFDWGNAHIVSLDSNSGAPNGALRRAILGTGDMLNWLDRDLRSTRQFWRIVFFHHPSYAGGRNYGDFVEGDVRKYILPILEKNGVQVVLNGHEHSYQRTFSVKSDKVVPDGTGTIHITSGGGGADLYPEAFKLPQTAFFAVRNHFLRLDIDGPLLTLSAIDDSGFQFDRTIIAPQPVLADHSVTFDGTPISGNLIHVHGWNLATEESFSLAGGPTMAGTGLSINNQVIPLLYVSPTQVVGVLPFDLPKTSTLTLKSPNGTTTRSLAL